MSTYTSGPWSVDETLTPDGRAAGGFDIVAPSPSGEPNWVGSAYLRADARLIAAAPTMLAAIISAYDLLTEPDADERDADRVTIELRNAMVIAMGKTS